MVLQGLVLMVAGMGIVVAFLSLLVAVMMLSAKVVPRFNHILPDAHPCEKARQSRVRKTTVCQEDEAGDAAIAVAVAAAMACQRGGGQQGA